jgi:hypothetical protein
MPERFALPWGFGDLHRDLPSHSGRYRCRFGVEYCGGAWHCAGCGGAE